MSSDVPKSQWLGDGPYRAGAAACILQGTAIRYVNPAAEIMTGYSRDELLAMPFWAVIHPDDRELVRTRAEARQRGGVVPWHYEVRLLRKDGTIRWVELSSCMIEYEGQPAVLGTAIDVSVRRTTDSALHESERRFRALIENSSDIVVVTDVEGRFCYLGPSVERILGFRPDALVGRDGLSPVHPDDRERVRAAYAGLTGRPGARATAAYRVRHRDGSWRWLESTATNLLDEPAVGGIIVNSRDVTDREEAVAGYRSLVDHSLQGLIILQDMRVVFANPAIAAITGWSADELRALPPDRLEAMIHPDDRRMVRARVMRRLGGEWQPAQTDHRFVRGDGSVRWVEAHASLIDYRGRPAVQVAYIDITERKTAEENARRHQHELAHVLRRRTMGELAAVFAHEVNQPLTAITNYAKGCAHRLRGGSTTPDQLLGALDEIAAQAVRAGEIIRRVRGFVGRGEPQWQAVQLNALIDEVLPFIAAEARERNVRLQVERAPDLPALVLDVVQIEQVILNLLRNALDAVCETPGDGAQLSIRTHRNGDAIEVAVSDTGPGLQPEVAADIFEPFVTSKPGGLGMGLSICRTIVAAHGGRLWAVPNPERGMTFTFALPLTPPRE